MCAGHIGAASGCNCGVEDGSPGGAGGSNAIEQIGRHGHGHGLIVVVVVLPAADRLSAPSADRRR